MQQEILVIIYCKIEIIQKIQLILYKRRVAKTKLRYVFIQITSCSDSKGLTEQGHLTEKLMKKRQNLYSIALEQNVDQTVHQLQVALAVGTVYFSIPLILNVKTESCHCSAYLSLILRVFTGKIQMVIRKVLACLYSQND